MPTAHLPLSQQREQKHSAAGAATPATGLNSHLRSLVNKPLSNKQVHLVQKRDRTYKSNSLVWNFPLRLTVAFTQSPSDSSDGHGLLTADVTIYFRFFVATPNQSFYSSYFQYKENSLQLLHTDLTSSNFIKFSFIHFSADLLCILTDISITCRQ